MEHNMEHNSSAWNTIWNIILVPGTQYGTWFYSMEHNMEHNLMKFLTFWRKWKQAFLAFWNCTIGNNKYYLASNVKNAGKFLSFERLVQKSKCKITCEGLFKIRLYQRWAHAFILVALSLFLLFKQAKIKGFLAIAECPTLDFYYLFNVLLLFQWSCPFSVLTLVVKC